MFGVSSASEIHQHEISTTSAGIEGVDNVLDDATVLDQTKASMISDFMKPCNEDYASAG